MKTAMIFSALTLFAFVFAEPVNLLKPANKEDSWRLEQIDGGKAEMKVDDTSVTFQVTAVDSTDWHVQAVQTDLDLKEGVTYKLKFSARSPDRVMIVVNAMIDQDDWHEIGLHEEVNLDKEYKEYSFEFQASGVVANKNRISFVLGFSKGQTQIKDVALTAK